MHSTSNRPHRSCQSTRYLRIAALVTLAGAALLAWRANESSGTSNSSAPVAALPTRIEPPVVVAPAAAQQRESLADIRQPLMQAFAVATAPGDPERRHFRDALASSGVSSEGWTDDARTFFSDWRATALDFDVELSDLGCYGAGCMFQLTHRDFAAFEAVTESIARKAKLWPGGKIDIAPETLPNGEVVSAWILVRPHDL